MTAARIEPLPGTSLAEDKDAARVIREEVILPALREGESVVLNFGGVELATQSFIHALISEPIRQFGEEAVQRIEFRDCSREVRELVLTVVEYTLMAIDSAEDVPQEP